MAVYKFERDHTITYACIVEADSLEEAKKKAEQEDWPEYGEGFNPRYWGFIAGREGYSDNPVKDIEELDEGYEGDEWDWVELEDDDFFNNFK